MGKSPFKFISLLLALSIPFWVMGAFTGQLTQVIPVNLPVSALMFVCPFLATAILSRSEKTIPIRGYIKDALDARKINNKAWYLPTLLLMPLVMVASYWVMRLIGMALPGPSIPAGSMLVFFLLFLIPAVCEEVGWTGYLTGPMQARYGAFGAGILIGFIWAAWHWLPLLQAGRDPVWILWHSLVTILARLIMIWLYNNTAQSVFSAVLFHTMINVSEFGFPNYGSHDNPMITCLVLAVVAGSVVYLWGPQTLAEFRFARPKAMQDPGSRN